MTNFFLAFLMISSCTFIHRVTCNEGIDRIPETRSKVDIRSIVPERFMNNIDAYVKRKGYETVRGITINPNVNQELFQLIVSNILDETLKVLDKFIVLVVAMVERNKTSPSLEFVLDYIELNITKLSGCLEFLFDNGADLSDALTWFIFFSGIKSILKTSYGEYYTYENVTKTMFVRIEEQQWPIYLYRVPTEVAFRDLAIEMEQSLEEIFQVYRQTFVVSGEWLTPKSLKWTKLFESNSRFAELFKETISVDNTNVYDQYLRIAREFDSAKVLDFYVNIGIALDRIIWATATDTMSSFFNLILRLIVDSSNETNSIAQIKRAVMLVNSFLASVRNFENWMSYSKRLVNTKKLLDSPAIKVLQDDLNYCQDLTDFPSTLTPFLFEFEDNFKKYLPGVLPHAPTITNQLIDDSIDQPNIMANMERNVKIMKTLFEETTSAGR